MPLFRYVAMDRSGRTVQDTQEADSEVGLSKALELCWLGDMVDAAEALRIGLVNRVVPHERLDEETRALAVRLAAAPQTSVRAAKANLRASFSRSLEESLDAEYVAQAACWASDDSGEGVRAFVEKRAARYDTSVGTAIIVRVLLPDDNDFRRRRLLVVVLVVTTTLRDKRAGCDDNHE